MRIASLGIVVLLLLASCDTSGMETLSTEEEITFDLRIYEYLDADTSLAGTFSLTADKAFDISQTTQKIYPTASPIRSMGMQDTQAHTSVPSGGLFFVRTMNNQGSISIRHITSRSYGKAPSKHDMFAMDNQDGVAFNFFLLERPNVILPDSIMVTYGLYLYTETDTVEVEEMLYVTSTDPKNLIRESQMDVAQGASLTLAHGAPHLFLEFDSNQIDETIYPCLVIESPMEGFTLTQEYCSNVQPDGKYEAIDITRGFPLTDEAIFRFFLLRKPSEDAQSIAQI